MKRITLAVAAALLLVASCNNKPATEQPAAATETKPVNPDGEGFKRIKVAQYSIALPDNMTQQNNLNDDASLQYADLTGEFYIITIDETKTSVDSALRDAGLLGKKKSDTSLWIGFCDLMANNYKNNVQDFKEFHQRELTINGLRALRNTFEGKVDSYDVFYTIDFIEGKDHLYQVMTWTMTKFRDQYKDKMDHMLNSFREE